MILQRILEHKNAELRHKESRGYLADLKGRIRDIGSASGLAVAIDATRSPGRQALPSRPAAGPSRAGRR